jgi:Leucine-rich repeat (LRR) protein
MKISTRKSDKNKLSSKINENLSSKNNYIIDENQNNLNNSKKNENINNNLIEKSKENLQNLKYIFPFLKEELNSSKNNDKENNYSLSEYNKIVSSINKNKSNININKNEEDILKGKINIIDKIIYKYMPSSADSKVIKIHEGLTSLTLKIDKNFNMMNDIGFRLPNLIELNLQNSEIESIIDIGTSFNKLEKLNVSNCGLNDLSGLICFKNLKELYASNNKISDLIDIEMCDELKIIDLSNNLISNEDNLLFLNSCQKLQKVILVGNKIKTYNKDLINKNILIIL